MRRTLELEARLRDWADAYGGDKYGNVGWHGKSSLHDMIVYQGRAPQGLNPKNSKDRTPADAVNDAIVALEKSGSEGYRSARILRAEYFMREASDKAKISALRLIGVQVRKDDYHDLLWDARTSIAIRLGINSSVDLPAPPKRPGADA